MQRRLTSRRASPLALIVWALLLFADAGLAHPSLESRLRAAIAAETHWCGTPTAGKPECAAAKLHKAELLQRLGRGDEARTSLNELDGISLPPGLSERRRWIEAGAQNELPEEPAGMAPARYWRLVSERAAGQGDAKAAARAGVTALEASLEPSPELVSFVAEKLVAAGEEEEALQRLVHERTHRTVPVSSLLEQELRLLIALDRHQQALDLLRELVAQETTASRRARWQERRGDVLAGLGETIEARQAYQSALEATNNTRARPLDRERIAKKLDSTLVAAGGQP